MSYNIPRHLLGGLSVKAASSMGMPHQGAYYLNETGDAHQVEKGIHCIRCRVNPATNAHHEPPKGLGGQKVLILHGQLLRPALHALCGSGTTGCHEQRHAHKFEIVWEWEKDIYKQAWWEGEFFREGLKPHSPDLYDFGEWVIR